MWQWYGTLDRLVAQKKPIALFLRLRTLFALNVDLVFHDLTSTYFEGVAVRQARTQSGRETATGRCWWALS